MCAYPVDYREVANLDVSALTARLTKAPPTTVAIPVYNAPDAVQVCLDSVLTHTPAGVTVLVIDDASPDQRTVAILDEYANRGVITLVRHETNQGFTRTANELFERSAGADVILLNSDTEVGPLWWQRMRWVAYSADRVATVSVSSNDAGHISMPVTRQANHWHPHLPWDSVARLMGQHMYVWSQEWPAAAGFCLYFTRAALDAIGGFDHEAFPIGYGEEVDFAQRALEAGFVNLIAPHAMVKHGRSQSFGDETRLRLIKESRPELVRRYPTRKDQLDDWKTSAGNQHMRIIAQRLFDSPPPSPLGVRRAVINTDVNAQPGHLQISVIDSAHPATDVAVHTHATTDAELPATLTRTIVEAGVEEVVVDAAVSPSSLASVSHTCITLTVPIATATAAGKKDPE